MFKLKLGKFTFCGFIYGLGQRTGFGILYDNRMKSLHIDILNMNFAIYYGDSIDIVARTLQEALLGSK